MRQGAAQEGRLIVHHELAEHKMGNIQYKKNNVRRIMRS